MAKIVQAILLRYKMYDDIDYVVSGCYGGNPLLQKQPLDYTIQKSIEALNEVRKHYPWQRMIVYGLPPTVSIHVGLNHQQFDGAMYEWVFKDINAVFLPLQKKFTKLFIWPKAVMTMDGVHLSPQGKEVFDNLSHQE